MGAVSPCLRRRGLGGGAAAGSAAGSPRPEPREPGRLASLAASVCATDNAGNPSESANAIAARRQCAPRARVPPQSDAGDHTVGIGIRMDEGGDAQGRWTSRRRALSRLRGDIICGRHAARKPARRDAARDRRPRQRRRRCGRGHARDRRAAAAFRHRDAPAVAARAQRSARAAQIVAMLQRRAQRGAGERCRHAGDQRSRRAARARGPRRRASRSCRFPARTPPSRRFRPPGSPRSGSSSSASCRRRPRRGASSLAARRAPAGRARRLRGPAPRAATRWRISREALGGERTLVVARELTKKFESITQTALGEARGWFAADSNRERGEFVLLVDAPPRGGRRAPAIRPSTRAGCWRRSSTSCRRRARRASLRRRPALPRDALYAQALALKPGRG